jgi:hypothetical protein
MKIPPVKEFNYMYQILIAKKRQVRMQKKQLTKEKDERG